MGAVMIESSVSGHSRSDLELDFIGEWLSSILSTVLVNEPPLVQTIMAVVEDDVSHVSVTTRLNIEASASVVSDISSGSFVPLHVLSCLS